MSVLYHYAQSWLCLALVWLKTSGISFWLRKLEDTWITWWKETVQKWPPKLKERFYCFHWVLVTSSIWGNKSPGPLCICMETKTKSNHYCTAQMICSMSTLPRHLICIHELCCNGPQEIAFIFAMFEGDAVWILRQNMEFTCTKVDKHAYKQYIHIYIQKHGHTQSVGYNNEGVESCIQCSNS